MKAKEAFRYLAGYVLGAGMFLGVIPGGLWLISRAWPARFQLPPVLHWGLAALLFGIGVWFMIWSNWDMFFVGQGGPVDGFNVAIHPRTKHLLIAGPYKHTRNPMVFGAFMLYLSLAIGLQSWSALAAVAVLFACVPFYLKATEEKRLLRDFGQEYEEYRKKVPMIVPFLVYWKK